jgi:hypothetical protein
MIKAISAIMKLMFEIQYLWRQVQRREHTCLGVREPEFCHPILC